MLRRFRHWCACLGRDAVAENHYQTIVQCMTDLVLVIDREGAYLEVAETRVSNLSQISAAVLGKHLSDIFPAEQARHFQQIITQVLASGTPAEVEYAYGKGSYQRWYSAWVTTLPERHDAILCVARDITKHKQDQDQHFLRSAALQACANGVLITDAVGAVEWVNPAFTALTGYTSTEAIGKHPRDLVNSGKQSAAFYQQLWQTILGGEVWSGELINRRKDGSLYTEAQTVTPVRDAEGVIRHFVAVKQDISARKQFEEKMQLQASALDAAANSIVITDHSGAIQWVNAAFTTITGYSQAEALGKNPRELVKSGRQSTALYQQMWATLLAGQSWRGELVNRRKDHSHYTEEKYITPVLDAAGRIGHFISIGQDISARKQLQISSENDRIVLELIARNAPLPDLLSQLLQGYEQLLPGMIGSVLLLDPDQRHLRHGAAPHLPADYCAAIDGAEIGPQAGSCGTAAYTNQTVIVADIASDPLWADYRELALGHGLQACWSMPIRASSGLVLGTFAFYFRSPRSASAAELQEIAHGADLASLALERQQSTEQLAISEQRFARAVVAANTGIWDWDLESGQVYLSPLWKRLLGYADTELGNQFAEWATRLHPQDEQAFYAALNAESATGAIELEHRLRHKDGSWHWFRMRATTLRDASGQLQRITGAHEDITEARQIAEVQHFLSQVSATEGGEDFLQSLTRFLASTLDLDYVVIARMLTDGQSASSETFFHAGNFLDNIRYSLVGTPCSDLAATDFCYFPSGICALYPEAQNLASFKAESFIGITLRDTRHRVIGLVTGFGPRPLAEPQRVERTLRLVALRAAEELERRLADEALNRSETRFRTLFDHGGDMVFILDTNGLLDCNQATLDGFGGLTKPQLLGLHPSALSPAKQADGSDSQAAADAHIAAALATGGQRFEWIHQRLDNGEEFPVEVVLTAMTLDGQPILQAVVRDISERRRVELQLQQTLTDLDARNRELQDFAFVASHDLQEPLRKIRTFADRLLTLPDQPFSDKAKDYLERSSHAAARMQNLIDDLLAYSRVGSAQLLAEPVDLGSVLQGVIDDLSASIEASAAQITVGPLPTIDGDASQLRQLLQNLLSNALKFHAPGQRPEIQISASKVRHRGDVTRWQLRIQDDGIGFAAEYAESIFAPFKRLHSREQFPGTGIGLAIVRRIVDRHHGEIRASSEPGHGATFTLILPERQVAPPPRSAQLTDAAAPSQ